MNEIDMESIIAFKPILLFFPAQIKEKIRQYIRKPRHFSCYYVNAGPTVQYDDIKTEVQI